ncbi:MAG: hypothetical protein SGJ00_04115 [bacterium]|nr:hypothetical protein [bacterium]
MKNIIKTLIFVCLYLSSGMVIAQDKTADMSINFVKADDKDACQVTITSNNKPVAEVAVKLYVKRLFGNLSIGNEVSTDENGIATFEFPNDIPLNAEGKLLVLAKVEDDENYGSMEVEANSTIGAKVNLTQLELENRSISGTNAPYYFIAGSLVIFAGIWGAIIYVVLLVFKIKKAGTQSI